MPIVYHEYHECTVQKKKQKGFFALVSIYTSVKAGCYFKRAFIVLEFHKQSHPEYEQLNHSHFYAPFWFFLAGTWKTTL